MTSETMEVESIDSISIPTTTTLASEEEPTTTTTTLKEDNTIESSSSIILTSDLIPSTTTTTEMIVDDGTPPPLPPVASTSTREEEEELTPITIEIEEVPIIKRIEPTAEELALQVDKKRKQAVIADEAKKRSKRMFGLLQSTLQQAKKQVIGNKKLGGQNVKFQEVQERLNKEKLLVEGRLSRGREEREIKGEVEKKLGEIAVAESIYKTRHANKLNLASFLCTSFTLPPTPNPASDNITTPFFPLLPHSSKLPPNISTRPLYYLPKRLLPDQEDQIEDQLTAIKKAIRREKEDWEEMKGEKLDEIDELKEKRSKLIEDSDKGEREEQQRKRREEEEKEERVKEGRKAVEEGEKKMEIIVDDDVKVESIVEDKIEPVVAVIEEETSSTFSIKGIAVVETPISIPTTTGTGDEEMEW